MEIYVIRHTKVDVPPGYCYGQTDVNLLNDYPDEVNLLKKRIPTDIDVVITSPLKRCTFIADSLSQQYSTDNRLQEMNFGTWEMTKWDEIPKEQVQNWMDNITQVCPPYGENLLSVQERVSSFLDDLRNKKYQKVLLVTHAGPIRCIWNYILQTPLSNTFKLPIGFGEVLHFNLGETAHDDFIIKKE
ncbi:alpha-ribazole phosphatase [Myroides sp. M-43]|uniref:alpha-ribazole phosphatase n=1 Tax=Myroides oncorhynchi TaxID=2893756 RepID=UPI001E30A628|nr:alpha-ribazole phosphatase [Myroides oncorhynchi]MCC9042980.1 alpha-ribazole phosphatase [Myroides oncorhynchi]